MVHWSGRNNCLDFSLLRVIQQERCDLLVPPNYIRAVPPSAWHFGRQGRQRSWPAWRVLPTRHGYAPHHPNIVAAGQRVSYRMQYRSHRFRLTHFWYYQIDAMYLVRIDWRYAEPLSTA